MTTEQGSHRAISCRRAWSDTHLCRLIPAALSERRGQPQWILASCTVAPSAIKTYRAGTVVDNAVGHQTKFLNASRLVYTS